MTGDFLIAGGGIAGLAVARALGLDGRSSIIVERGREHDPQGLAINLPGNAIAALHRLGLADEISASGRPTLRREYRTDRGRLLFEVDELGFWGADLQPRAVRRIDLLAMLSKDQPVERFRRGAAVAAATQHAGGVEAALTDGTSIGGQALIAADGVRSTVRRLVFGEASPQEALLASTSWRFMASNPGVECWTLWAGRSAMILLIPVDEQEVYGWATASDPAAARRPEMLIDAFSKFPTPARMAIEEVLRHPERLHSSPIEEVRASQWSDGRVLLVGDAAHATAPVWAQGAALAMEDALSLRTALATTDDWAGAVARYEAMRRPRVMHVQNMTDRLSRAARMPTALRNLVMPFIGPRSYAATYGPLKRGEIAMETPPS